MSFGIFRLITKDEPHVYEFHSIRVFTSYATLNFALRFGQKPSIEAVKISVQNHWLVGQAVRGLVGQY